MRSPGLPRARRLRIPARPRFLGWGRRPLALLLAGSALPVLIATGPAASAATPSSGLGTIHLTDKAAEKAVRSVHVTSAGTAITPGAAVHTVADDTSAAHVTVVGGAGVVAAQGGVGSVAPDAAAELPDTAGPSWQLLVVTLLIMIGGTAVLLRERRRTWARFHRSCGCRAAMAGGHRLG